MKSPLILYWPLNHYVITQGFGGNDNESYKNGGLLGHPALDLVTVYDDIERFAQEGRVYKTINFGDSDLMRYRAVMQIVEFEDTLDCYEVTYGHCHDLLCKIGTVAAGDAAASEGNTGEVYTDGRLVTRLEKAAGSTKGTHLHFQLRYCRQTDKYDPTQKYLSSQEDESKPYFDGTYYYLVPHFYNGYNGCIDPTPFMQPTYAGNIPAELTALQALVVALKAWAADLIAKRA